MCQIKLEKDSTLAQIIRYICIMLWTWVWISWWQKMKTLS